MRASVINVLPDSLSGVDVPRKVSIVLVGKDCRFPTPQMPPLRQYIPGDNVIVELRVLAQRGIDVSVLAREDVDGMLLRCYTSNVQRDNPLIGSSHGKYGTDGAPALSVHAAYFWRSVSGLLEANKRVFEFNSKNSRLPSRSEMEDDLGLECFLAIYDHHLSDAQLYALLGHGAEYSARTAPRKARLRSRREPKSNKEVTPGLSPQPSSVTVSAVAASIESPKTAEEVTAQPVSASASQAQPTPAPELAISVQGPRDYHVSRYGREMRAPIGFWSSIEATKEARRRINEFVIAERRLPSQQELEIRLGLLGLVKAIQPSTDLLNALGYRSPELKEPLRIA